MNRFLTQEQDPWALIPSAFTNAYLASAKRQTNDSRPTDDRQTKGPKSTDERQTNDRRASVGSSDTMNKSSDLVGLVKTFEGFYSNPYGDYGQKSIGYGTRAKDDDTEIDEDEATRRLNDELNMHRDRVVGHLSKHGYEMTPAQLDSLTSFDYNTGAIEKLTGSGTRTPQQIADAMLQYNKAGGKILPGLVNRRKTERDLFLNGY